MVAFFPSQNKHNVTGNGSGLGKQYMGFVRCNMDQVQKKITDDLWVVAAMEVSDRQTDRQTDTQKNSSTSSFKILSPILFSLHLTSQHWYADQVQMLCTWLTERLDRSLHPYQCTCLAHIVKVGGSYCKQHITSIVHDSTGSI